MNLNHSLKYFALTFPKLNRLFTFLGYLLVFSTLLNFFDVCQISIWTSSFNLDLQMLGNRLEKVRINTGSSKRTSLYAKLTCSGRNTIVVSCLVFFAFFDLVLNLHEVEILIID